MPLPTVLAEGDIALTTVHVRTRTGGGPRGAKFADSVPREVFVEDERRQVRNTAGDLTVSETTLYDALDAAELYTGDTEVDLRDRTASVLAVRRRELGDPDVDHVEVNLT